jgi:hypothetical protein
MKKIFTLLFTVCLLGCMLPAMAQKPGKIFSAGFGLEAGIPLGDARTAFNATGGVTARFALRAGPGYATFTTGAIVFAPKNLYYDENLKASVQIPFKAGYKYSIIPHLFVMGELGYSSFQTYYDDGNDDIAHTSTGGFTYAPAVGAEWGVFEVSLRYESVHVSGGNVSYVGARCGFNF